MESTEYVFKKPKAGKADHDFHLVPLSVWPLFASIGFLIMAAGAAFFFHDKPYAEYPMIGGLLALLYIGYRWWGDCIKEGREDKAHTGVVQTGLRLGMLLFICSEVMFFFAFFYSFFYSAILPLDLLAFILLCIFALCAFTAAIVQTVNGNEKGAMMSTGLTALFFLIAFGVVGVNTESFPPETIHTVDPWTLPLFNTLLLLLSGTTVTWAHASLLNGNKKGLVRGLQLTIILGVLFTCVQAYEYYHVIHHYFKFDENNYSSNFFMATGFHGLHVLIGTIFLIVCLVRAKRDEFSEKHHLGFEFAAWYWHFVDVVWLFLFMFIYVWGR